MNKPTCDKCGSDDVYIKSIFYWNEGQWVWMREQFCDEAHCNACGNEAVQLQQQHRKAEVKT